MKDDTTTWRRELDSELGDYPGESIVACTLSDAEFDTEFDGGYGGSRGVPFTAWSENRVYFPVVYDGAEWVKSAPRNPCDEATEHVGGE